MEIQIQEYTDTWRLGYRLNGNMEISRSFREIPIQRNIRIQGAFSEIQIQTNKQIHGDFSKIPIQRNYTDTGRF